MKGFLDVRALGDFMSARFLPSSQDRLVGKTGKVPVTLENGDFEFVTKVAIEKVHDEFASPAAVPFVLPQGLREGPQDRMDLQIDTANLDPGSYQLMLSQVDGRTHPNLEILAAPPAIANLPIILNQGVSTGQFVLKGQRLDLLKRIEVASGSIDLAPVSPGQAQRGLTLRMASDISAGTSFAIKAFIEDRSEPLLFSDAVRIVGPRPDITEVTVSKTSDQSVQLDAGELPGGVYLSAMLSVEQLQSNSIVKLGCEQDGDGGVTLPTWASTPAIERARQGIRPSPLIYSCAGTVRANNRSPKRMIFLTAAKISQKDDDTDPASCGMLSRSTLDTSDTKFVKRSEHEVSEFDEGLCRGYAVDRLVSSTALIPATAAAPEYESPGLRRLHAT